MSRFLAVSSLCALLAACASAPSGNESAPETAQGYYKVGKPYQINGNWYYPHEDYSYDQTGIASWYGPSFVGQRTANGEIFTKNELTAAHKTLPLPTLARVTNLENGRSIVVRINDRGPFSGSRIIDVSERAAQLLGFEQQGTARVRVQVLADESKAIADAMRHYGTAAPAVAATQEGEQEQVASAAPQQAVQTETLAPVRTTPAIHRQLEATQPVPEVVQMPVPASTRLYVQAGAFTQPQNAERLQQNLARFGNTTVSPIVINGTKFYRVRVGPVASVPRADALILELKKAGASGARTVVE
ncbi:MAG: septal ring lytic transglycosylase RlpA family protein [Alphaproteobacteria bacterium]|nr:septal ring lytic transglycosylase RlpA family protein [Alphaproteobacteria bacterium]